MFKKQVNLVSYKVGVDLNEEPKQEEKKGCYGKKVFNFFSKYFFILNLIFVFKN